MLFAAGFGTRMGALTADRPKPLIEVAGKALIDHALDLVAEYGPDRIVANLHYKAGMLKRHLAGSGVLLSTEEPEILDTGGGLRAAAPLLSDGPCFTLNTDAVWRGPNPLSLLARSWNPSTMDALLLCIPKRSARGHDGAGDFRLEADGRLTRGPGLVYSGLQIIRPELATEVPEAAFSMNVIWNRLLTTGRLRGVAYPGQWCDVGHPAGIRLAEEMLGSADV